MIKQFELEEKLRINSILLLNRIIGIGKYRQMLDVVFSAENTA